jgi:hypothetical protein
MKADGKGVAVGSGMNKPVQPARNGYTNGSTRQVSTSSERGASRPVVGQRNGVGNEKAIQALQEQIAGHEIHAQGKKVVCSI